jgi:hypothetical protein
MSPLNVMLLRQCLQERYAQRRLGIGRPAAEIANERHLRLLRARCERPRGRRAAKQRDELTSLHVGRAALVIRLTGRGVRLIGSK